MPKQLPESTEPLLYKYYMGQLYTLRSATAKGTQLLLSKKWYLTKEEAEKHTY